MRFPSFKSAVFVAAALGTVVPVVCLYRFYFGYEYSIGKLAISLWPSSLLLMATDGHEHDPDVWVPITISILANVILYAAIAAILWLVLWLIRRAAARTP